MHRFFTGRICLGLIAFGCGSPGDLDRSQFPELENTGYPDRVGAAGSGAGGTFGGTGGGNAGGSGGVVGTGGTAPNGGSGGSPGVSGTGGQPSSGGTGQGGTGTEPAGCPSDITVLTNRPASEGGCAGAGCHVPGGTPPDLTSPGVEARVLDVASSAACSARPYVGANDSVIEEKITNPDPSCGEPMPFFAADRLNATDKACIVEWIDGVAGGM
jgi:hypothetical protein